MRTLRWLKRHKWLSVVLLISVFLLVSINVPSLRDRIYLASIDKIDNPDAVDVSFAQLKSFLDNCQTIQGNPDRDCSEYAEDLHNEAEAQGIRAAIVVIPMGKFPDISFHAINAFETTDEGVIYIDAGLGYAYEPRRYGIAEKGADGVYWIELQVGEMEIWYGSYMEIEPQLITEVLGKEKMFWVCW